MTAKEFFVLVSQMRQAQREFFKTRSQTALKQSKELEKLIDKEIDRVNRLTTQPELNFG